MENTGSLLFNNQAPKYFLYLHGKPVGPLTAEEVYQRVETDEITLMDYVWVQGWSDWKRLADEAEFAVLIPKKPSSAALQSIQQELQKKSAPPATPPVTAVTYYVFYNKAQYGPFSLDEITKVFKSNKVDNTAFVWIPGWPNWKPVSEVAELAPLLTSPPLAPPAAGTSSKTEERTDKRVSPRKPLVARLFVTNDNDVIIAVCRDISIGGMQVLTDRIPGEAGTHIKLNVSPADAGNVKTFVAEGEVVRILEDGRGFSFRFTKLSPEAKSAIEEYISH